MRAINRVFHYTASTPMKTPVESDSKIWDAWLALYQAPAISVALELGVFEALKEPTDIAELQRRTGYSARGLSALTVLPPADQRPADLQAVAGQCSRRQNNHGTRGRGLGKRQDRRGSSKGDYGVHAFPFGCIGCRIGSVVRLFRSEEIARRRRRLRLLCDSNCRCKSRIEGNRYGFADSVQGRYRLHPTRRTYGSGEYTDRGYVSSSVAIGL